jgi:SSS family solute:Na+ symporter
MGTLTTLDYAVFAVYFAAMLGLSWRLGRKHGNQDDYYVGGRDLPWWAVGLSTAATQTSAIGFMSVPAFVALSPHGGLKFLQGEIVLPLAIIFVMVALIPFFRGLELVSVYDYLQRRFSPAVKYLISGVFLFSRGLGAAVGLYMTAIVFSTVIGLPLGVTILIIGVFTLIYDAIGGIEAVVYTDVIQMGVLLLGAVAIVVYVVGGVGGLEPLREIVARELPARLTVLDLAHHGLGDGVEFSFWPQFFGGFFLLASYYGCDQTQAQRELSTATLAGARHSLIFNGFFRFPLGLLYGAIGVALAAYLTTHQELAQRVAGLGKIDYLVPLFIMQTVPSGLKALIFVAVLAAAMSSLDSSINSLSAATQTDFVRPLLLRRALPDRSFLRLSKAITCVWGGVITLLAFFVGRISDTVLESIGIVGSAFYGPMLGAFVAGVLMPTTTARGVIAGVLAGVAGNAVMHFGLPRIFWMWWNLIGCAVTLLVAWAVSAIAGGRPGPQTRGLVIDRSVLAGERRWIPAYALLAGYCLALLLICWALPWMI